MCLLCNECSTVCGEGLQPVEAFYNQTLWLPPDFSTWFRHSPAKYFLCCWRGYLLWLSAVAPRMKSLLCYKNSTCSSLTNECLHYYLRIALTGTSFATDFSAFAQSKKCNFSHQYCVVVFKMSVFKFNNFIIQIRRTITAFLPCSIKTS